MEKSETELYATATRSHQKTYRNSTTIDDDGMYERLLLVMVVVELQLLLVILFVGVLWLHFAILKWKFVVLRFQMLIFAVTAVVQS